MLYHIDVESSVQYVVPHWCWMCRGFVQEHKLIELLQCTFHLPKSIAIFWIEKKDASQTLKPNPFNVLLNSGKLVPGTAKSWAKFWWLSAVMLMQLMVLSSETQMELLSSSAKNFGKSSALDSEALSLRDGLAAALKPGDLRVHLEGDSKILLDYIND